MGISGSRSSGGSQGLPTQQPTIPVTPAPTPTPAPPPFQFAPRPQTVMPYQTPERLAGSGTGAQSAFGSQQPMGFNPMQAFLSSLPELGSTTPPPDVTQAYQVPPSTIGTTPAAAPQAGGPSASSLHVRDAFKNAIQNWFG